MKPVRQKPGKPREVAVRPERMAKIRNPELFEEKKMSEIPAFISSKKSQLEEEYIAQSDIVQVMARLSTVITSAAQEDVATANSADTTEERLAVMNQCVIRLVNIVAQASAQISRNSLRHRFSLELLDQMLHDSDTSSPEAVDVEEVQEDVEGTEDTTEGDPEPSE